MRVSKGEEKKADIIFAEIMTDYFPNLMKGMYLSLHIQ